MKRENGMGGLYKRSDGMWIGSVTLPTTDGRQRRKTVSSKDRNEAIRKLRDLQQDVAKGRVAYVPSMLLGKWLQYWLEQIVRPNTKPNTYDSYEQSVRIHILPRIGGIRLDKLTPADVRDMIRDIQQTSTRNAQKCHQTLGAALTAAAGDGLVDRNVCAVVSKPAHVADEIDPFTPDQVQAILGAAYKHDLQPTRWLAAFLTGLRQGELLGMEWDRVDLEAGVMDMSWQLQALHKQHGCGEPINGVYPCIRLKSGFCPHARWELPAGFEMRECHRSLVWTRPKTVARQRFDVPLVPELGDALVTLRAAVSSPLGLVWHEGGRPISPRQDNRNWATLLKVAGVPHVKQHAIRHTVISYLQEMGVDEPTRMAITGHSSVVAHRGYVHVSASHAAKSASVLSSLVSTRA